VWTLETIAYALLGVAVLFIGALIGWVLRGRSGAKKVAESERLAEKIETEKVVSRIEQRTARILDALERSLEGE